MTTICSNSAQTSCTKTTVSTSTNSSELSRPRLGAVRERVKYRPLPDARPTIYSQLCQLHCSSRKCAAPKTEKQTLEQRVKGVPSPQRRRKTRSTALDYGRSGASIDCKTCGDHIPSISKLSSCGLQYWLTRFVLEVRKKDGSEFPPKCDETASRGQSLDIAQQRLMLGNTSDGYKTGDPPAL